MRARSLSLALLLALTTGAAASAQGAFLGIDARDADRGVRVVSVVPDGPAAKAGVQSNDVIFAWNDAKIANLAALGAKLSTAAPGSSVSLGLHRGPRDVVVAVRLGTRPAPVEEEVEEIEEEIEERMEEVEEIEEERVAPPQIIRVLPAGADDRGWMGVMLGEADGGVRIEQVIEGSPAQKIGIQAGEILRTIDGKAVKNPDDVIAAVGSKKAGEQVQVGTVARRDGTELEYTYVFKLGKRPADLEVATPILEDVTGEHAQGFGFDVVEETAPAKIAWSTDLGKAWKKAVDQGRPVMVKFTATWCGPCKTLDQQAFSDAKVIGASRHFECVSVDIDEQPEVAKKYEVTGIPRVLFLDAKGKVVEEFLGARPTKDVLASMHKALEKTGGAKSAPPIAAPRGMIRLAPAGGVENQDVTGLRREVESLRKEVRELKEMIRKLVEKG